MVFKISGRVVVNAIIDPKAKQKKKPKIKSTRNAI